MLNYHRPQSKPLSYAVGNWLYFQKYLPLLLLPSASHVNSPYQAITTGVNLKMDPIKAVTTTLQETPIPPPLLKPNAETGLKRVQNAPKTFIPFVLKPKMARNTEMSTKHVWNILVHFRFGNASWYGSVCFVHRSLCFHALLKFFRSTQVPMRTVGPIERLKPLIYGN